MNIVVFRENQELIVTPIVGLNMHRATATIALEAGKAYLADVEKISENFSNITFYDDAGSFTAFSVHNETFVANSNRKV
jgi:hypothetical protein